MSETQEIKHEKYLLFREAPDYCDKKQFTDFMNDIGVEEYGSVEKAEKILDAAFAGRKIYAFYAETDMGGFGEADVAVLDYTDKDYQPWHVIKDLGLSEMFIQDGVHGRNELVGIPYDEVLSMYGSKVCVFMAEKEGLTAAEKRTISDVIEEYRKQEFQPEQGLVGALSVLDKYLEPAADLLAKEVNLDLPRSEPAFKYLTVTNSAFNEKWPCYDFVDREPLFAHVDGKDEKRLAPERVIGKGQEKYECGVFVGKDIYTKINAGTKQVLRWGKIRESLLGEFKDEPKIRDVFDTARKRFMYGNEYAAVICVQTQERIDRLAEWKTVSESVAESAKSLARRTIDMYRIKVNELCIERKNDHSLDMSR